MPRPLVKSGLPGPGQDVFPEAARETGRNLGLDEKAEILKNETKDDGGGASESKWVSAGEFRARIDSMGVARSTGLIADQINESSTHLVSLDPGVLITTGHRLRIRGQLWYVTAKHVVSDPLIERVEVKEVIGES